MGKVGEMGDMGGGGWENGGHSTRDVGCGGLWRGVVQENGRKMGETRDEIPIFHSSIFPVFPRVVDLPHNSLCTNQLTALTDGKMENFCHSATLTATAAGADACI